MRSRSLWLQVQPETGLASMPERKLGVWTQPCLVQNVLNAASSIRLTALCTAKLSASNLLEMQYSSIDRKEDRNTGMPESRLMFPISQAKLGKRVQYRYGRTLLETRSFPVNPEAEILSHYELEGGVRRWILLGRECQT